MRTDPPRDGDPWMDRFLAIFARRQPVDATFIGWEGHDDRLPDVSSEGVAAHLSEMRDLLSEAERIASQRQRERGQKPPEEQVAPGRMRGLTELDRRIAQGYLRIRLWEMESGFRLSNPSVHASEAVFGLMSLLLPGSAPSEGRDRALVARMHDVRRYLGEAQEWLDTAPAAWTERALRECRGALSFLREGVHHLDTELGDAPERAAEAFEAYRHFLSGRLLARPSDRVACGEEAFTLHLREGHFLDRPAAEIAAYARDEIERTKAWLEESAGAHDASTPAEVLAALPEARPSVQEYPTRFDEIWLEMRHLADERGLVTWPDFPIRYVPRPTWARSAAPDLYFLFYRSPAAYDRPPVHDYLIAPLESGGSEVETEALLRANNDSVIKLNHVVHHGGIGHHVQNWHAFRSPLRVGRIAAVDGASRIAMFCAGTMAEGWACYATDVMAEAGGLTPLEMYAERHGRVRMCARAVVDVELHHGRMSLEEGARFYVETAGMSAEAARAEAVKNSMNPGAALMYLVGTDMIHDLRADLEGILGDRFVLRDFHDDFLSWGSIPVKLVADEMRRRASLGLPLNAHAPGDSGQRGTPSSSTH